MLPILRKKASSKSNGKQVVKVDNGEAAKTEEMANDAVKLALDTLDSSLLIVRKLKKSTRRFSRPLQGHMSERTLCPDKK